MIPRYSLPEMAALFTDEARLSTWLQVEILAVEAWASIGQVPADAAAAIRQRAPVMDADAVAAVGAREKITDHDVAAFVDVVQEMIGGDEGKWVHYGLTSSDVVDTALCATLSRAADLLVEASTTLIEALRHRAHEFAGTPMVGRTHGIHAEPTTFGAKLALWCLQADRDRRRLVAARAAVAVGKLSGAVGTYSNVDPAVEAYVCRALGLVPVPATQVIARDRHAEYLWACASVGATVEMMATEIRHLQRTEVREVEEPFKVGQKGSSAMPHKRNPIKSEQLSGMARVLRGYLGAGLEDVALWHERDISHSSVERIILPDASLLAYYVMVRMAALIDGMVVHPDRMLANLDLSLGLVFSQPVLLALVGSGSGLPRDAAYRIVQRDARVAWDEGRPFRSVLEADPEVPLDKAALDEAFDLRRSLRHIDRVMAALDAVPGPDEFERRTVQ
jgi:adenylosuccinate lyase